MMKSVGLREGLIRFDSENGIANKEKLKITARIKAYIVVLVLLFGIVVALLVTRRDVATTILRTPGLLYQDQPNNQVSNLYNIKMVNKTHERLPITLKLETPDGKLVMVGNEVITVEKESVGSSEFFIYVDRNKITQRKTKYKVSLYSGDKKIETVETNFLGPVTH